MFSERLDMLIQSSLQDGILTDQEKAAIIKRAKAEGEDIDEVEIYIDSLLQKRQKELNNSDVKRKANTSGMDELKHLIDAAMADGIITSKEREVITRKAAALGMDAAEVDVYLDAEIQKAELAADVAKREKIGKVCPQCGKQVPPLTIKCECGYEFTGQKQVSSVQLLSEKIDKILSSPMKATDADSDEYKEEVLNREKRIRDAIEMFPVPNTKEDIVEFLSLAVSNANKKVSFMNTRKGRTILYVILAIVGIPIFFIGPLMAMLLFQNLGTSEGVLQEMRQKTWRAKFDQVLMKGRSLRGDSDFQQQLDYFESMVEQ